MLHNLLYIGSLLIYNLININFMLKNGIGNVILYLGMDYSGQVKLHTHSIIDNRPLVTVSSTVPLLHDFA